MKILIISNYPSPSFPQSHIFVYRLVQEMVDIGHEIVIVSPIRFRLKNIFKNKLIPDKAKVYRPNFFSFSAKQIGSSNTYYLTHKYYVGAIKRVLRKKDIVYDVIYCHFWKSGFFALDAISTISKPLFIAFGDSNNHYTKTLNLYSPNSFEELLGVVSGYISVSNENTKVLLDLSVNPKNILLAPNASNTSIFYPRNKHEMRQKYCIPLDIRVVIFVGKFKESKGYNRVLRAIRDMDSVYGIFLGEGHIKQDHGKIIFKGSVEHIQVAEMLSCADVFVLPTQDEGSCNAIVEAMTCGLPIVASDIPPVKEQCNSTFSILVKPNSVDEIREAIASIIYDNDKLQIMSKGAIAHSVRFSLNERALKILHFLGQYIVN